MKIDDETEIESKCEKLKIHLKNKDDHLENRKLRSYFAFEEEKFPIKDLNLLIVESDLKLA